MFRGEQRHQMTRGPISCVRDARAEWKQLCPYCPGRTTRCSWKCGRLNKPTGEMSVCCVCWISAFCFQSHKRFWQKFTIDDLESACACVRARVCVCMCVCVCVCTCVRASVRASVRACVHACVCVRVCLASDSSETIKVIIIKLGTVTASELEMHRVLIILTVAFIQGHIDLILNIRLFEKVFKHAHHVCCKDSPTKGV